VAAFDRNGEPDEFISDLYGAAPLKVYFFGLKRINDLPRILFTFSSLVKRDREDTASVGWGKANK
jgi:hypothetical protein